MKAIVQKLKTLIPARSDFPEAPRAGSEKEDLIPYSAQDLKYLWALWDEAQKPRSPGLRYRNICLGAVGMILAGGLISALGLSGSMRLGSVLMLGGALIGAWFSLKSLRAKKQSEP
jgi:hypothetical protein